MKGLSLLNSGVKNLFEEQGQGRELTPFSNIRSASEPPCLDPESDDLDDLLFKSSLLNELDDIFLPLIRDLSLDGGQLPYVHSPARGG